MLTTIEPIPTLFAPEAQFEIEPRTATTHDNSTGLFGLPDWMMPTGCKPTGITKVAGITLSALND